MEQVKRRIGIWGDSVAKGVVLDAERGRYVLLRENFAAGAGLRLGVSLENRARFGCTVAQGREIVKRSLENDPFCDVAVLEFGGNDCDFDWREVADAPDEEHVPKTTLADFLSVYREMVSLLRARGTEVFLMTLPPLDAVRYFAWIVRGGLSAKDILHWLGDVQTIYRWHERYNLAVWELSRETGCEVIDIRRSFLERRDYRTLLCEDGIHPNEAGHAVIETVLVDFANEKLARERTERELAELLVRMPL
jgi:lysophospholipase L1-like esterase